MQNERNFTPFPVLKTKSLTLRQLDVNDDVQIFSLRSDSEVNKYLDRQISKSVDDARAFIQMINNNVARNDSVYWAITITDVNKLIGTICLFNFSEDGRKAEIGFELLPSFQGQGIMQQAVEKVIEYGFDDIGLKSLEASVHPQNIRSIQLLEKLHFKQVNTPEIHTPLNYVYSKKNQ